jgi:hypothetical protein
MERAKHNPSSCSVFLVKREQQMTEEEEKVVEEGQLCEQEQVWNIIDALIEKVANLETQLSTSRNTY